VICTTSLLAARRKLQNCQQPLSRNKPKYLLLNLARHKYLALFAHNWQIRLNSIKFLVRNSQQKPEILLVLQSSAAQDQHFDIRYLALEAVLTGWPDHFITLVTLIDRIQFDPHRDVQNLAITALIKNWLHHPQARRQLQQISESGKSSWSLKYLAIEALAEN
jgi:uncharacterized protein YjiS (DUF1127 family)